MTLKKNNGMSLIQVMIALGLMSVIGLGVAELMVTSSKVNKRSEIKLSQLILLNEIQAVTSNSSACNEAVKTVPQTFNVAQAKTSSGWDLKLNLSGNVVKATYPVTQGLDVKRLYFKMPAAATGSNDGTNTTYLGRAFIEFNVDDNIIGGSLKPKQIGSIFLKVKNSDKSVVGCEKEAEVPISEVCTNNLGGTYDATTKKCTLPTPPPTVAPPSGSECTPGDTKTEWGLTNPYVSGGYNCNRKYLCTDGYWVPTSDYYSCAFSCFIAETNIIMNNYEKLPISQVQIGDYVMGEDGAINEVYDIEVVPLGGRQLFSFNDGPHFVTAEHPFKTTLGWKSFSPERTYQEHFFKVKNQPLEAGDLMYKEGKSVEMLKKISTRHDKSNLMVYNLRLKAAPISSYGNDDERSHTYFANGYLVHNK